MLLHPEHVGIGVLLAVALYPGWAWFCCLKLKGYMLICQSSVLKGLFQENFGMPFCMWVSWLTCNARDEFCDCHGLKLAASCCKPVGSGPTLGAVKDCPGCGMGRRTCFRYQCVVNIRLLLNPKHSSYWEENQLYPSHSKDSLLKSLSLTFILTKGFVFLVDHLLCIYSLHPLYSKTWVNAFLHILEQRGIKTGWKEKCLALEAGFKKPEGMYFCDA